MTTLVERERKLDVDATFAIPDLHALVDHDVTALARRPMILAATYYDSPNLELFEAGIALRRRTGGDDAGWHLKRYRGIPGERTEFQLPMTTDDEAIPEALIAELPVSLRALELSPVLRLRTERTATELTNASGAPIGELTDDRVIALRLDGGFATFWRELEIEEQGTDSHAALAYLERLLLARGARPAGHDSKLARGLGRQGSGARVRPVDGQLDVLTRRIRLQVLELVSQEGDVRSRRDDGVHQMRVAVRRLRSCLRTFGPAFDESVARRVGRQLKWLGDLLGAERDAEVTAKRITQDLGELSSTDILGPVSINLGVRSHDEISAAHDRLMQALDSDLYRRLLEELALLSPDPAFSRLASKRWLRQRVAKRARRTIRLQNRAAIRPDADRAPALHEVRKSAKHVRYGAETLIPIEKKRAKALAADFEALQGVLGEHHDAIVTQQRLRAEGARAGVRDHENGFTYGALFALEAGRAADAAARVDTVAKHARRQAKWWLDH